MRTPSLVSRYPVTAPAGTGFAAMSRRLIIRSRSGRARGGGERYNARGRSATALSFAPARRHDYEGAVDAAGAAVDHEADPLAELARRFRHEVRPALAEHRHVLKAARLQERRDFASTQRPRNAAHAGIVEIIVVLHCRGTRNDWRLLPGILGICRRGGQSRQKRDDQCRTPVHGNLLNGLGGKNESNSYSFFHTQYLMVSH